MDLQLSGIPTIYDMILDDDSLILIEEYIHGQTLEQLLNDQNTWFIQMYTNNEKWNLIDIVIFLEEHGLDVISLSKKNS